MFLAEKRSWSYGFCEACLKNAHNAVNMIKRKYKTGNPNDTTEIEMWACPKCGSSKTL
jgi:hypothetical protein